MTYTKQGPFSVGGTATAANLTAMDNGIAAAVPLDGSAPMTGQLQVITASKLVSGNQDTGVCGVVGYGYTASASVGYMIGFHVHLTNAPTSITLTNTGGSTNASSANATQLSVDGFLFFISVTGVGAAAWYGRYTTVGNCLLAVDPVARTFDHHCDGCGVIARGVPLAALTVHRQDAGGYRGARALGYRCPQCETWEHWNTELAASEELDATPQGAGDLATTRGAQAALIRALQRLVGLSLVDESLAAASPGAAAVSRPRRRRAPVAPATAPATPRARKRRATQTT